MPLATVPVGDIFLTTFSYDDLEDKIIILNYKQVFQTSDVMPRTNVITLFGNLHGLK
jgi:hypothetical protein